MLREAVEVALRGGRVWRSGLLSLAAVLVLYFMVPVDSSQSNLRLAVGILASLAALSTMFFILLREVGSQVRGRKGRLTLLRIVLLVELVAIGFSMAYFVIALNTTDQFVEMHTRIDALYFTIATMATVGYGDVHPEGQLARALVAIHISFNLVILTAVARLISERMRTTVRERSEVEVDEAP